MWQLIKRLTITGILAKMYVNKSERLRKYSVYICIVYKIILAYLLTKHIQIRTRL